MKLPDYVLTAEIDHGRKHGDRLPLGLLRHDDGNFYWHDADSGEGTDIGGATVEEAKDACRKSWGNKEWNLTGDWV